MKDNQRMLEEQLQDHEEQLRGLTSYLKELNDSTAKHGTPEEYFREDLLEAQHNIEYYEEQIAQVREQLKKEQSRATYFVYKDSAGEWRWQLQAANHRVIADSGEGYHHKQDCLHAIDLVKDTKDAPVRERPPASA